MKCKISIFVFFISCLCSSCHNASGPGRPADHFNRKERILDWIGIPEEIFGSRVKAKKWFNDKIGYDSSGFEDRERRIQRLFRTPPKGIRVDFGRDSKDGRLIVTVSVLENDAPKTAIIFFFDTKAVGQEIGVYAGTMEFPSNDKSLKRDR